MNTTNRLQQLLKMLEDDPLNSFLRFAIAKEFENLQEYEKAKEFYLKILDTDPEYTGVYFHLGKIYEQCEDWNKAKEIYQKGIIKAQLTNDLHSVSELKAVLLNLEIEQS
ncbi:MAG: tetratricopeptide repeat protein [Saprospiraceae bacterium]|nr:tetratricopeptide repeat protein [Saprospiraceae bacterium]